MARILIGNIKGPQGEQGIQGEQGPQGMPGPAGPTGQIDENTPIEFTSGDALDPKEYEDIPLVESGSAIKILMNRFSSSVKNNRYFRKLLGNADISKLSEDGTVTGALSSLNSNLDDMQYVSPRGWYIQQIANVHTISVVSPATVTGAYSESTGKYYATVNLTLPIEYHIPKIASMNVKGMVQSSGIYDLTFVGYTESQRSLTFYVSANAPFTAKDVTLHVEVKIFVSKS